MIQNIIDRRTRQYRWSQVDVIAEPTWPDNACPDSDQAARGDREPGYAARTSISLSDAIVWATTMPLPMTLYIHDAGDTKYGVHDVPWPSDENSN